MGPIEDTEVQCLARIATAIKRDYIHEDAAWADSPFAWIRTRPSRQIGKIGEQLVAGWCTSKGMSVVKCRDSEADLIIEGHRVEIKFSTLWETGYYVFQQFRDQNYEFAICLGISPLEAHCWVIPKLVILQKATPQHTGKEGEETFWLHISAKDPPAWLSEYGGNLQQALEILRKMGRASPQVGKTGRP